MVLDKAWGTYGGEGRTPQQREAIERCCKQIQDLFRPYVESAAKTAVKAVWDAVRGKGPKGVLERIVPSVPMRFEMTPFWSRKKLLRDEIVTAVDNFTCGWIDALWAHLWRLKDRGEPEVLDTRVLDDAMLPPDHAEFLQENYLTSYLGMDPQVVISILQAVRLALPPGSSIPDAAYQYFRIEGIEVLR